MPIRVESKEFPLMVVTFEGTQSDEEFRLYLEALRETTDRALSTGMRVAFVMDARKALAAPASQRRMMGEWMKNNDADTRATCAGFAFVFESAIIRGFLTAILWLHPLPAPHAICATVGEALLWCREQLEHTNGLSDESQLPTRVAS